MEENQQQEQERDAKNRIQNKSEQQDKLKRRPSIEEKIQVQKLMTAGATIPEIARKLKRPEEVIRNIINEGKFEAKEIDKEDLISSLRRKHYWPQVKRSLKDSTEVEYFEREWASIMSQLMIQDVLHTDEIMVRDLIMQDVNCFRITSATANMHKRKEDLEKLIYEELTKERDEQDLTQIKLWRDEVAMYTAALVSLTKEYSESQGRKDAAFKGLKTTREQRYKEIKESGKDIFSLVMTFDSIEQREKQGRYTALMGLAADKTKEEWTDNHEFADGEIDSILLSSETIEKRKKQTLEPDPPKTKEEGK